MITLGFCTLTVGFIYCAQVVVEDAYSGLEQSLHEMLRGTHASGEVQLEAVTTRDQFMLQTLPNCITQ